MDNLPQVSMAEYESLVKTMKSDDWKTANFDWPLQNFIAYCALAQVDEDLSRVDRVFVSGRISAIAIQQGLADKKAFNRLLVASDGIDLADHYLTMFDEKPIEICQFPDDTSASITNRIALELGWRGIV